MERKTNIGAGVKHEVNMFYMLRCIIFPLFLVFRVIGTIGADWIFSTFCAAVAYLKASLNQVPVVRFRPILCFYNQEIFNFKWCKFRFCTNLAGVMHRNCHRLTGLMIQSNMYFCSAFLLETGR